MTSPALLTEWRRILCDPNKRALHGLNELAIEALIADTASRCALVAPAAAPESAPDPDDQHVWDLLMDPGHTAVLVTLDRRLLANPPKGYVVVSAREFVTRYLPRLVQR